MKKIIAFLIVTVCIFSLYSCKNNAPAVQNREYNAQEVEAAARELILKSVSLNEIYWGDGIPHSEDRNTSSGVYFEAVILPDMGFETIDELKVITEKTFSKAYSQYIYSTVFEMISDGDEMIMSRYYQKYSVLDDTTPEAIMVNTEWKKIFTDDISYNLESIKAVGSEGERVYVSIDCTVTREGYEPQSKTLKIALIEEEGGWRIDSPTYSNYDTTNGKK